MKPLPRTPIVRWVAVLLGPVLPFLVMRLEDLLADPGMESGDPTLAGLYLVIGCTAGGPALGLVSAVRLARFPAFPGWLKALAFAGVLANGLALLLLLDLLAGF